MVTAGEIIAISLRLVMADNIIFSSIYLGNVADIDPNEPASGAENAADLLGTYGSVGDPLWQDITTLDTDSTSSELARDDAVGGAEGTLSYDIGLGPVTDTLDSIVEYNITVHFTDGSSITTETTVVQTNTGDLFLLADDFTGELAGKPIASISLDSVITSTQTEIYQSDFDSVAFICFALGTDIKTPNGSLPVQDLTIGDLVCTMDQGPQPIRWIGKRVLNFDHAAHKQKPWIIKSGSMGHARPATDLVLSPQHHIILQGADVRAVTTGSQQCLASVKSLGPMAGVRQMHGKRSVTYISLLLDCHQILWANGLPVESLYLGPYAMSLLTSVERSQIYQKFPWVYLDPDNGYGPHARPVLKPRQATILAKNRTTGIKPNGDVFADFCAC